MKPALIMMLSCFLTGCASLTSAPPGLLYSNLRSPRAYRSATPADVVATNSDATVEAHACNRSLLYLFSWGDNGYIRAIKNATEGYPNGVLYDVRVDARVRSFLLGLYNDNC